MTTLRMTDEGLYFEQTPTQRDISQSRVIFSAEETVSFKTTVEIREITSTSPSISLHESTESESEIDAEQPETYLGPSILRDPKASMQMRPFEMEWCFGLNNEVPIINLTTEKNSEVMYVSNNNFIRYDYVNRKMSFFQAHQNKISTLSYEQDKRFVVTADKGDDHCIVVWDTERNVPIYTAFDPYPESGVLLVGMDPTGRYIVTVGKETDYAVDFWLWTRGIQTASGTLRVNIGQDEPKKIAFNPDKTEHVMVVFESGVLFFQWDENSGQITNAIYPAIYNKDKIGLLISGTFVKRCHECYVSSNHGYVLKFGIDLYTTPFANCKPNNSKVYVNAVKVSRGAVTCMLSIDDAILIGDSLGSLQYYDKQLKIQYWQIHLKLPPILCISISKTRKKFSFCPTGTYQTIVKNKMKACGVKNEDYKDVDIEASIKESCVDCLISTADGKIHSLDTMRNRCDVILDPPVDCISAIDTHTSKPYLLIGCQSGSLYLYNYLKRLLIITKLLPEPVVEGQKPTLTCVKYCSQSLNLVCGRSNGEIIILSPILLEPRQSTFRISESSIKKIAFSADSLQFAYIDSDMTTFLFIYDKTVSEWNYRARIRAHYKDITDIMFSPIAPFTLFTLGSDRHLMKYNNYKMRDLTQTFEANRNRIYQTAIPHNMMWYPLYNQQTNSGFVLVANDQHKFRLFSDDKLLPYSTALGPAYGCYKNTPVRKMVLIPRTKGQYMAFMCRKHIGLQLLPADGNPYRFVGCAAHQEELVDMVLSYCGGYAFTFGVQDKSVIMWNIRQESVRNLEKIGGSDLEPYYCLLEGGKNGWLFQEMQDLFYYMQVLNSESPLPRKVSDTIPLSELPDLIRACGFFPSDFEAENIIIEMKHRWWIENNTDRKRISFLEFVQLFINHRPPYGYSLKDLEDAFNTASLSVSNPGYGRIKKDCFINLLVNKSETYTRATLVKCLAVLLGANLEGDEVDIEFVPDEIDFGIFVDDILGIDMKRREMGELINEENK